MPSPLLQVTAVLGACVVVSAAAAAAILFTPARAVEEGFETPPLRSLRSSLCARLSPHASRNLLEACKPDDFGDDPGDPDDVFQDPQLSLDGVAACVASCAPRDTCGKLLPACETASAGDSSYRCEVTHIELRNRDGSSPPAPERAPYRLFIVAAPGCLTKPPASDDRFSFRDDSNSLRLVMTFPEKLRVGYSSALDVPFPDSWSVRMRGSAGWSEADAASFSLPVSIPIDPAPGARSFPAMSVFKTSTYSAEYGTRSTSLEKLANMLHVASAREPPREDGLPSDALFAAQPARLSFTVGCRTGDSGVGSVFIKTVPPGSAQEGGIVTDEALRRVRNEIIDGERDLEKADANRISWNTGAKPPLAGLSHKSPITGNDIPAGSSIWLCVTLDTWSGHIVDFREVLFRPGAVSVSRRKNTGVFVDLSSEAPIEINGDGGVALGIGNAVSHFFSSKKNL